MASTGVVVYVDNFDNSDRQLRPHTPILCCYTPCSAPRSFEPLDSHKPNSRQGPTRVNPPQTTHGYRRRARYVRLAEVGLGSNA